MLYLSVTFRPNKAENLIDLEASLLSKIWLESRIISPISAVFLVALYRRSLHMTRHGAIVWKYDVVYKPEVHDIRQRRHRRSEQRT